MYKTSKRIRMRALAYYYAHREEVRQRQEDRRREQGVPARKPRLTDAQKLAIVRTCQCGARVTTPSLLLQCSNRCLRCRQSSPAGRVTKARGNRAHRDSPVHARARVKAYKLAKGCLQCGRKLKAIQLHFHHRDPKTKLFKIAWGVYHVAAKALWLEIAKCDVLCKDCHKEIHEER